jgi:hypothetical protein
LPSVLPAATVLIFAQKIYFQFKVFRVNFGWLAATNQIPTLLKPYAKSLVQPAVAV